jgi:Domain of unknown function (DUF5666)
MKKTLFYRFRGLAIGIVGLMMVLLMTGCSGFVGTGNSTGNGITITGTVTAVDAQHGTVTLDVNGQSYTISGLNSSQVSELQGQVGKTYQISATQNSNGTYTTSVGNNSITLETDPGVTPTVQTETSNNDGTPGVNDPGSIKFNGKVLQVSSNVITVAMANGRPLSMSIVNGQTDMSDFNGTLPTVGQLIKAEATANSNGSFLATKLNIADSGDLQDQSVVEYQGITTSAVAADNVIHFNVGNQSFSYSINSSTELKDFNYNAHSIGNNQAVKVKVQFQGNNGIVLSVDNTNS